MWGYRDSAGRIVATNPNDMIGNTGWEKVPDDTVLEDIDDLVATQEPTEIEALQAENARLGEMLAQTNADFAGFMDYYFTINPE